MYFFDSQTGYNSLAALYSFTPLNGIRQQFFPFKFIHRKLVDKDYQEFIHDLQDKWYFVVNNNIDAYGLIH